MDIMLNKNYGLINNQKQLNLEKTFVDAIKEINNSSYLVIVIASQPYAARGFCSENDAVVFRNRLETLLGEQGVYLDSIYYCPYHPGKGGEDDEERSVKHRTEYHCCRPDIGMIENCAGHFNISLNNSFFIGYSPVNIPVVKSAGLKILLVKNRESEMDEKYNVYPDYTTDNVYAAAEKILNGSI
jgi:histidinol-phosphate phosphatase family protein